jgi:hypothetical protein
MPKENIIKDQLMNQALQQYHILKLILIELKRRLNNEILS